MLKTNGFKTIAVVYLLLLAIWLGAFAFFVSAVFAQTPQTQSIPQSTGPSFFVVQADVSKDGKPDILQTYISRQRWKTLLECNAWLQSDDGVYTSADLRARAYRADPGLTVTFHCHELN